jgi:ribosomal protein S21
MQVITKKYGGDPMRSYKALMRKLSREGVYKELRDKEFYKSKSERRREDKVKGEVRVKQKQKLRLEHLLKELPPRKKPVKSNRQKI